MAECYFHDPNQISKSLSYKDLFRLCANTEPQRESIFTKSPSDVLDHATSEIAIGSKAWN